MNVNAESYYLSLIEEQRRRADKYQQALWDVWVALGHDTDGDTGPGALISGMGEDGFIEMVLRDATQWRKESEDDYDADVSRLEQKVALLEFDLQRIREEHAATVEEYTKARQDYQTERAKNEWLLVDLSHRSGMTLQQQRRAEAAETEIRKMVADMRESTAALVATTAQLNAFTKAIGDLR